MDIFGRIRNFYDFVESNPLTAGQIALYFALLHTNNKARWQEWFTVASQILTNRSGLDRTSVIRARNILKQKGLIDFKTNGNKATKYTLLQFSLPDATTDATADETADATVDAPISKTNNQSKTKERRKTVQSAASLHLSAPSLDEIRAYCDERGNNIDAEHFIDYYTANGWKIGGKTPMKDWKAAIRTWEKRDGRVRDQPGSACGANQSRFAEYSHPI